MKREEVIRLFPERIRKILQQAYWNPQGYRMIVSGRKPCDLMAERTGIFCGRTGISDET